MKILNIFSKKQYVCIFVLLINKTKMFEYGANFIVLMEIVWNFN